VARFLRIAAILIVALGVTAALTAFFVYRASQQTVAWYEEARKTQPAAAAEAGREMEKRVLALATDVKRPDDRWEAIFSDQQINGWLAVDLVEKYPDLLPPKLKDPRVAISPGGAKIGCRYESSRMHAVVHMAADVYLTDEPNVVAVHIRKARAGAVPLPLQRVLDQVTKIARNKRIPIRWVEQDGAPVALITMPERHEEIEGVLRLETLQLDEGEVYVSGRTLSQP